LKRLVIPSRCSPTRLKPGANESGCMVHGTTRQSAIKNAEDAIKFWIKTAIDDGLEIPQPCGRLMVA